MLVLFRTKTFIKDYKKTRFSDKLYTKYILYISILLNNNKLPTEAKNHNLTGNLIGYKEFHLSGDLLIIYQIDEKYLKLIRIGTHSELFK
jgi:mRNA interferase YafQ